MNNDEILILFVAGTLFLTLFAVSLIVLLLTQKNKQYRFRKEKEQMQMELLKTTMELQEQALTRMSLELHDNIGFRLQKLKQMHKTINPGELDDGLIKQLTTGLDEVIRDTRNVSHRLNTEFIRTKGLIVSVNKEVEEVCRISKIDCTVAVNGDYYSMDEERELIIFRMVQEAIANVIRHAQATALQVVMDYMPDSFTVTIADNGKGIHPAIEGSGMGLMNMRNRARMIKGQLDITPGNGAGTCVTLSMKK